MKTSRLALLAAPLLLPALLGAQAPASPAAPPVVIVPQPATTLPLKFAPKRTGPAITATDLMSRLYQFADDSMMGRDAGTLGNFKGTEYIAAEAKRFGLKPAGENGTWFQTIPFKNRSFDSTATITAGGVPLAFGTDWVLAIGTSMPTGSQPVVFGGTFGDSSARIAPAQAAGKIVAYRVLPKGIGEMQSPQSYAPGTAAVIIFGLDPFMGQFRRPTTFLDDPSHAPAVSLPPLLLASQKAASALFEKPLAELALGTEAKATVLDPKMVVKPVPFAARNVVAILPGSDPRLRGEYVAVGAHNDHVGYAARAVDHDSIRIYNHIVRPGGAEDAGKRADSTQQQEVNAALAAWRTSHPGSARADSISNGADDDGSGSVTVMEIAEKLAAMKVKPKRSVLFVWHVGEEKGLLGSRFYTDHPTVPRDSIVAQLNIDMIGRGDAWDVAGVTKDGVPVHGGPNYLQLVGSRRLSTELGDLVEKTNTEGKHGFTFDYSMDANGHPMNIYCRSDHYEYARYNIPVTFFTTGGHSDYHQVTDEPQYIDYPHMARVGNLIADIAVRTANLGHRVKVDGAKMDPNGSCKQ